MTDFYIFQQQKYSQNTADTLNSDTLYQIFHERVECLFSFF